MIKKYLIYAFSALMVMQLASCFDDDSTLGTKEVGEINVSGIEESYTRMAFIGEHLQITPEVKAGYSDDDMEYEWLLIGPETGKEDEDGNTIEPEVIGKQKDLDYVVSVIPGTYQVRFIATSKTNGYKTYTVSKLNVQTDFTEGFYIMKETSDGNTDLDMYSTAGRLGENLVSSIKGAPMTGRPQSMDVVYNICYINPDNDKMEATNAVCLTTDKGQIDVSRSTDLKTVFSRSNLLFDTMPKDEKPYRFFINLMSQMYYFSSSGLRTTYISAQGNSPSSGRFSTPVTNYGGSRFAAMDVTSYGCMLMWDETAHNLMGILYNGLYDTPLTYDDGTGAELTTGLTQYDCLYIGYNWMAGTGTCLALLENKDTGKRYLYQVKSGAMSLSLKSRQEVGSNLHLAKATAFCANFRSARYLYCVDGGKLYACLYDGDRLSEVELKPEGIVDGETITYVGNQYWNGVFSSGDEFDYLVIGTQKGDNYAVYMYNMTGGVPEGKPVKTIRGKGTVRSVRFMNSSFDTFDSTMSMSYGPVYNTND